jgi:tRNA G18 (ribose-2'-O)-methylase SpoU
MARIRQIDQDNGFFGIGILSGISEPNLGTLWRSAYILGASFIFTVDKKYKSKGGDVTSAWTKIPLYHYDSFDDLKQNIPYSTKLIGVEMGEQSQDIYQYQHPDRAIYLLGNEQSGLPPKVVSECHELIKLPGDYSLNVAVAGSLIMYDRDAKRQLS